MSKQIGLIKLKGNIGGISFYRSGGKDLAKTANGPSKEKILKDPAFARTRENNTEFGASATAAKALRLALVTAIQTMGDPRLASRLTKLFKEINLRGIGVRGQRPITLSANRTMLENLDFNNAVSFSSIFNAPFTFSNDTDRLEGTITVPAFLPSSFIDAPSGATHFRLLQAIGVVSDYVYNGTTLHYDPTDPLLNTLGAVNYSAITSLSSTVPVNFTLVANLPGTPTMTATVSVVQCIGIEFFQRIGSTDYLLAQDNCMKSVKLF
ncbi:MAG: hypothetical protein JNL24_00550 [Bacteroidia bacterium]|nr:hypothetical protein [Bacteroidia bacterium]